MPSVRLPQFIISTIENELDVVSYMIANPELATSYGLMVTNCFLEVVEILRKLIS